MSCPRVVSRRDPRQANCTQAPLRRRYTTSTTISTGNHSLLAVLQTRWRLKTRQASRRCSMSVSSTFPYPATSSNQDRRPNVKRRRLYRKPENVRNTTTLNPDASAHGLSLPTNTSSFLPTDRTKRVKDARSEAQKEIEEYRNQKDEEFQQFESQHTSGNKKAEQDAEKETNEKLEEIKGIGKKTGPKVVEDLLKAVMDVQPQVPDRVDQPVA